MKTTVYARGRYGNNVVNFRHPTREYDEVTGMFYTKRKPSGYLVVDVDGRVMQHFYTKQWAQYHMAWLKQQHPNRRFFIMEN